LVTYRASHFGYRDQTTILVTDVIPFSDQYVLVTDVMPIYDNLVWSLMTADYGHNFTSG
jgi:hypothetical protein